MDTNVTELNTPSKLNKLKSIARNRKVQIGAVIAVTAVVSAVLARSEMFQTKFALDEVLEIGTDVVVDNATA